MKKRGIRKLDQRSVRKVQHLSLVKETLKDLAIKSNIRGGTVNTDTNYTPVAQSCTCTVLECTYTQPNTWTGAPTDWCTKGPNTWECPSAGGPSLGMTDYIIPSPASWNCSGGTTGPTTICSQFCSQQGC